jgi:hypothetical protein
LPTLTTSTTQFCFDYRAGKSVELNERDGALEVVRKKIRGWSDLSTRIGDVIRQAFDEAVMASKHGKFAVSELDKTEKAYIGLRVQLLLQGEFELSGGGKLDCNIADHEVDIKFTLGSNWMIPREATGELCLLLKADEAAATFSLGLLRTTSARLNAGGNQDKKRTISAAGKREISWIASAAPMPANFFLKIGQDRLSAILRQPAGQSRITELFRLVQREVIPRTAICLLASQDDPMKRARDARKRLNSEGIVVLCGRNRDQKQRARDLGFKLTAREWLSAKRRSL